ncbi:MAG: hypothetical protein Q4F97_02685 [Bacteroidales bacterium]|nr:hypothetical protein [Bacteroidales bacterium]
MKNLRNLNLLLIIIFISGNLAANGIKSIKDLGVSSKNSPEKNKELLQKAIDRMTDIGGEIFVEPTSEGYKIASGIILKKNVSLIGVHGPTGRGTKSEKNNFPTGSLFVIEDNENPFITVESATQIRGIQFYYPLQSHTTADKIIEYKPTITLSKEQNVEGVTLSCLTFYGEYVAMDFNATGKNICEQILFEHCYGYPLSGEFIKIDFCYDIPRILHCHINPANMREFGKSFSKEIIDNVISRKSFSYSIEHTDNAQMMDVFTFGVYGGIYLGNETYGQLTNFNLDCVKVGIYKKGSQSKNRNWQIAQGSIIANAGKDIEEIHPFIIEGCGHTAITNVEAFSGENGALTAIGLSKDYMLIKGDKKLTVSLFGCRMRNYTSDSPFTIENNEARIFASGCLDKDENFFEMK